MKLSTEAIHFFENLAMNTHHEIKMEELSANQSKEFMEIYSLKSSEQVKNKFNSEEYLADSIKVTEI